MELSALGWNRDLERQFAPHRDQGLELARVAIEDKHAYLVFGAGGEFPATISGKLLHRCAANADLPKVGDWVAVSFLAGEHKAVIHHVLPRHTRLARKVPGREIEEQVLATNVQTAFVVQALDPSYNPRRLERFLIMVHDGGIRPVVVLNKADLCSDLEARLVETQRIAGSAPVRSMSARTGRGVSQLHEFIHPGEAVVFIGSSGVGKSSLINRLHGEEIQATLEVRECDAKGRHATSWRELIVLPSGGLVIDTPGMREFHMWLADEGIHEAFPEIERIALGCHFRSCSHTTEKRCAVLAAVASGELPRARYEHFLKLKRELDYMAEERRQHTYQARRRSAQSGRPSYTKSRRGDFRNGRSSRGGS